MPGTDATVAGRYVFFNRSAFDGNDPAANASDDAAVSPAIAPLLPGRQPSEANVSGYARGLNGVMIDVNQLAAAAALSADDFVFRAGSGPSDPTGWPLAPQPSSITVRRGAGVNGSDRVTLVWPDGALRNTWLQVTLVDNADTGLATPDVFYFASVPGEAGAAGSLTVRPAARAAAALDGAGAAAAVLGSDLLAVRRAVGRRRPVDVSSPLDHNRDGRVTARDLAVVRQNLFSRLELVQPTALPPTYYVSPTGDDSSDGTDPLSAWRTVAKANSTALPPGAHVLFQRGGEWRERLVVSSSGTPAAPVVFGSYGTGLKPKFWGSDPLDSAAFQPVEGASSTYRIVPAAPITVNSIQANHAFFRSAYLVAGRPSDPAVSLALVKSTPGTWFQDPASGQIYVHTLGDDPRSGSVLYTASVRDLVVLVQRQHDVVIRNLVVAESAKYAGGYAFGVGESTNVVIEDSEAYLAGIHHFGAINTDNFVGRNLYSAWAMPDQGYGGASAYVSYSDPPFLNSRSTWSNVDYDERDAADAPYMLFYTHGAGMGDLVLEDLSSRGGLGLVIATEGPDQRVSVRGGVIENGGLTLYGSNTVVDGITLRGARAAINFVGSDNTVQNAVIDNARPNLGNAAAVINSGQNNTLRFSTIRVDPATAWPGAAVAIKTRVGAGLRLYGNIIDAPRAIRLDVDAPGAVASDHNLFSRDRAFVASDGTLLDLAQWRAATGQDASSRLGDPLFAGAAQGDLSLLPGSPAVDAFGATDLLAGVPTDLLGCPRPQGAGYDLGAFERRV